MKINSGVFRVIMSPCYEGGYEKRRILFRRLLILILPRNRSEFDIAAVADYLNDFRAFFDIRYLFRDKLVYAFESEFGFVLFDICLVLVRASFEVGFFAVCDNRVYHFPTMQFVQEPRMIFSSDSVIFQGLYLFVSHNITSLLYGQDMVCAEFRIEKFCVF